MTEHQICPVCDGHCYIGRIGVNEARCPKCDGRGLIEEVTIVVFRVDRKAPHDVYALMPDIPAAPGYVTAYQHIGQHSAADYNLCMSKSRPARPDEYKDLAAELESLGYVLDICKKKGKGR